ncbi:MAG: hypothetical protein NZ899_04015 [Thermoguttaceae bacterium]|nr:hypothetical protein [Thermoguttaceae bacterium]MDW8077700.1 hypothetical protein [Thermoguttaceae bacterium]
MKAANQFFDRSVMPLSPKKEGSAHNYPFATAPRRPASLPVRIMFMADGRPGYPHLRAMPLVISDFQLDRSWPVDTYSFSLEQFANIMKGLSGNFPEEPNRACFLCARHAE